ncbi:MAG: autotransporter domain-containing protein [Puniceicoccales bacterium]|jgi:autotransporter-associated beta strand protein|nr:autotransporter domain-containing protein [Puniceicoccales bacterium]
MRISKTSLFAAAAAANFLAAAGDMPAEVLNGFFLYTTDERIGYYVNNNDLTIKDTTFAGSDSTVRDITGGANIIVDKGATLMVTATMSSTFSGGFYGEGNIVKNGSGSLELTHNDAAGYSAGVYGVLAGLWPTTIATAPPSPTYTVGTTPWYWPAATPTGIAGRVEDIDENNVYFKFLTGGQLMGLGDGSSAIGYGEYNTSYSVQFSSGNNYAPPTLGNSEYAKTWQVTPYRYTDPLAYIETTWLPKVQEDMVKWLSYAQRTLALQENTGATHVALSERQQGELLAGLWAKKAALLDIATFGNLSGSVTVNAGELVISGMVSQWVEYPDMALGGVLPWGPDTALLGAVAPEMTGVSNMVLSGSAKLSYRNGGMAVPNGLYGWRDGLISTNVPTGSLILNFARNVQTGSPVNYYTNYSIPTAPQKVYLANAGTVRTEYTYYDVILDGNAPETVSFPREISLYSNDQPQTELQIGITNAAGTQGFYRIITYIDKDWQGSVGILSGTANSGGVPGVGSRWFKAGPGDFALLNKATFDGDVFVVGGKLILDPKVGLNATEILAEVSSVNLVGSRGDNSGDRSEWLKPQLVGGFPPTPPAVRNYRNYEFKMGDVPAVEAEAYAQLILTNDQTIHNLQVLFSEGKAPTDAIRSVRSAIQNAKNQNSVGEIYIAGTGDGTNICLGDNTLTVIQDYDGLYEGNFNEHLSVAAGDEPAGYIVKKGPAVLALLNKDTTHPIKGITILEGTLMANVQGLGYGTVTIDGGQLTIVQDSTGTLKATVTGGREIYESGNMEALPTLLITTVGDIVNGSISISNGDAGVVDIQRRQSSYYGHVIIEEGMTVRLNAMEDDLGILIPEGTVCDSFPHVASFTLRTGASERNRETTLEINNSDQRIRNFSGDGRSRVTLKRSLLVLNQEATCIYSGKITGDGGLVKEGPGSLVLNGTVQSEAASYGGATVVRQGDIELNVANVINSSAALVIKGGGAAIINAPQTIGALFGEAGALVILNETFTIGFSDYTRSQLHNANLANVGGILNMQYLATRSDEFTRYNNDDITFTDNFKVPGDINDTLATEVQSVRATNGTTVGFLLNPIVGLDTTAAAELAYAGSFLGSAEIVKTGVERLTLTGRSPEYTGKVTINQGILRFNADSLNAASEIEIATPSLATYARDYVNIPAIAASYIEISAPAGQRLTLLPALNGSGDIHKVGVGEVVLSDVNTFGNTFVERGRLVFTDVDGLSKPRIGEGSPYAHTRVENSGTLVIRYNTPLDASGVPVVGAAPYTHAGPIVGSGGVEKTGDGVFALTGSLVYGRIETDITSTGTTLSALSAPLPAGTLSFDQFGGDASKNQIRFAKGSKYDSVTGNILVPTDATGLNFTACSPANLTNVREVTTSDGNTYVYADVPGLLVTREDGILIVLGTDVVPATAGASLRVNGTIVDKDGNRLDTHGGVIERGDAAGAKWANVYSAGQSLNNITVWSVSNAETTVKVRETNTALAGTGGETIREAYTETVNADGTITETILWRTRRKENAPASSGSGFDEYDEVIELQGKPVTSLFVTTAAGGYQIKGDINYFTDPNAWLSDAAGTLSQSDNTVIVDSAGNVKLVSSGLTAVLGGELRLANLPYAGDIMSGIRAGQFEVAAGAKLVIDAGTATQELYGTITGAGVFEKTGSGSLVVRERQDEFTGAFRVGAGTLTLATPNALARAQEVYLGGDGTNGTVLNLSRGNDQIFHFLSGEESSVINMGGAKLYFEVPLNEGETRVFRGQFLDNTGDSALEKTGKGTLTIWRPADSEPNQLSSIVVREGVLRAAPRALGVSLADEAANSSALDILILNGAELGFYTELAANGLPEYQVYPGTISGDGFVSKSGEGVVRISKVGAFDGLAPIPDSQARFRIAEGRLIVDDVCISEAVGIVPRVWVKTGAIFHLNLTGTSYLSVAANSVLDYPVASGVQQHGTFAVSGRKILQADNTYSYTTLKVDGTPLGYTGMTQLIGAVELQFDATTFADVPAILVGGLSGSPTIPGLSADIAAEVLGTDAAVDRPRLLLASPEGGGMGGQLNSIRGLVLIQNLEGTFDGDIVGTSTGPGVQPAPGDWKKDVPYYGYGSALTIAGPEKFTFLGTDGDGHIGAFPEGKRDTNSDGRGVGNITVDGAYRDASGQTIFGGFLQVGAENRHAIDVINGGTLCIANYGEDKEVTTDPTSVVAYTGLITNSVGTFKLKIYAGAGTIAWTSTSFANLTSNSDSFSAETGTLRLNTQDSDSDILATFHANSLNAAEGAVVEVNVDRTPAGAPADTAVLNATDPAKGIWGTGDAVASRITGNGTFRKTGAATLSLNGLVGDSLTGLAPNRVNVEAAEGTLKGNFRVAGSLTTLDGATLAPGNSIGEIVIEGNFEQKPDAVLEIEISGSAHDRIVVGGNIILDGKIAVSASNTDIRRGTAIPFIQSLRNVLSGDNDAAVVPTYGSKLWIAPHNASDGADAENKSNERFILVGPGIGTGTPYEAIGRAGPALLVAQKEIAKVPDASGRVVGNMLRAGVSPLVPVLDSIALMPVPPNQTSVSDSAFIAWYDARRAEGVFANLSRLPAAEARDLFNYALDYHEFDDNGDGTIDRVVEGLNSLPATAPRDPAQKQIYNWIKYAYSLGAHINTMPDAASLASFVNNLAPLGYSSLVAMPASVVSNGNIQITSRLEQRRYDHTEDSNQFQKDYLNKPWEFYLAATGSVNQNGSGSDSAVYDFNTFGGVLGLDKLVGNSAAIGAALQYDNGSATLDSGGGKIRMNSVRATGYFSKQFTNIFYTDAGVSVGYASYDSRRRGGGLGTAKASPNGWNAGAFAQFGGVFALHEDFHLTPHVGLEYTHFALSDFTESGSSTDFSVPLRVGDFSHDSLRGKLGIGANWLLHGDLGAWNLRLSLDVSYAHEFLDTDADIGSSLAADPFGFTKNTVTARALPKDVVQVSPSISYPVSERISLFASYRFEYGFDGESSHNINLGLRARF